ncbi:TadE/TadG family type IV pilus assembly protein [Sphingomonas rubra]|uniref:TadE-like protein n=1 Tax=Sphingomonas rubra TaxID=634430 RepID=A0A1I5T812_9SPHN|nr:pilus assembly protein [Sphingomonas rubra]SFP79170.1 hypothetical protein SAMN04488241_107120 [Sphingomonas rubra]
MTAIAASAAPLAALRRFVRPVLADRRGVQLIEFAIGLPILTTLSLGGAEITNYATTRMRISQVALQLADNAARMGNGTLLAAKTITENDINDALTGAGQQAGNLDLYKRGRVIISDLEPMANPNTDKKYKIVWQRCRGDKTSHASSYGVAGATNISGIGGKSKFNAQDDNATMFVEVYYEYKPLIRTALSPSTTMVEIAAMSVRDRRDLTGGDKGVYNTANAPVSRC